MSETKNDHLLEELWQQTREGPEMTREEIAAVLRPRINRSSRILHHYVWTYLLVQMATLILAGANLAGYRDNPVMLAVEAGIALLAIVFAAYGVWLFGELRGLDRRDEPLARAVERRRVFHRSRYRAWMWITAFSVVLLAFALNSLVDNADGIYRVNKPLVFVGVQVAMVAFLAAVFRIAHAPYLQELGAVLEDLEGQLLDRTLATARSAERRRRWQIALGVLLLIFLALGAWLAFLGVGG